MTQTIPLKGYKGIGMSGSIAKWYANGAGKRRDQYRAWARKVAALEPGRDILEVAPGPGLFSIELARLGRYNITGLDISQTFVDLARENARATSAHVDFRLGNASQMPFADESFDFTFCSAAFKNFTDPVGALREMHRVLRPGGRAMVLDLRKDASISEIDSAVNGADSSWLNRLIVKQTFRHMLLKRAYTKGQLEQFALQTQFNSVKFTEEGIGIEMLLAK